MNLYTIYDWITSLLRTHNGSVSYKAIEASEDNAAATSVAASPTTATAAAATSLATTTAATANGIRSSCVQNVEVEFVPTLTFLFEKPIPPEAILETEKDVNAQTEHSPSEGLQHEASSNNVDNVDSDSDNDSTHTYIISRSSWTTTTATSSSTPYAVTSTDTSELLRQQNNLSLTEEEETVSSYSIEPPTSSMTIDMAEPQTSIATTRSEATSSVDVVATTTTATTTTTTTSSSIEEDIEEAIEISEVEEQLESLSEAAAYARPKQQEQSAKSLSKSSEESDAEEFRIDDSQLSGGQLAQHFIVVNETEDEDDEEEEELELEGDENIEINVTASSDDDFDISLPLEQRNVIHSRHDTDDGEEYIKATKGAEQVDQIDITPEASLSHQSTTHDVSELADEQQQENDEPTQATSQEHDKETDEQDHSLEEIVASNQSIEVTYEPEETTKSSQKLELITDLDAEEEKQIQIIENKTAKALTTLQLQAESLELTMLEVENDDDGDEDDDEEDNSLQLMKLRLMAMNQQQSLLDNAAKLSPTETGEAADRNSSQEIKQMERVPLSNEFSKDVLEDITEESERLMSLLSTTTIEEPSLEESKTLQQPTVAQVGSSSSLVSLNMLKQLEAKVQELSTQLETKDNCVASLNMQLDAARRESSTGPASARDTSSLMTNSTEYRTLQDELGGPTLDIYVEMSRRDETIAKLTESLQHSLNSRNQLQVDANRLADELQDLRRQLHEALETVKRSSTWEPEPNASQRISEISMDLISESEDDLDQHFLTDNEADRASRSSRERQLASVNDLLHPDWTPAFSKQIEQFQTYLLPNEQKVFQMVQRKFDDYLNQQLSLAKEQSAQEMKICRDQWESEKLTNEQTQQAAHAKQMEELRKYFEHKCADLEKQFSDDVFSHKSQHLAGDSSSECSEAEQLPEEGATASRETSPRKRKRAELLLSPSHRQITPCGLDSLGETGQITGTKDGNHNISLEIADLKIFYQTHIHELKRAHEDQVRKLTDRVKFYERRLADDDYKNLLSENTVDDQHWPKELILLREKFTAKSQLEITQLNIKHADEMSRLKLEYEKQLNRKNKRHSTFDSGRDLEQVINERDGLRELSKSFRSVLCRLAKCVANCEEDLNATLSEEVQRLLVHSRSQDAGEDLEQTLSSSLNCTASKLRLVPDVHSLLEVVEDPSLLQFIDSKSNEEQSEDFDLNDCLERLKSEASYLLHLSEDLHKQREHPDPVDEPEKQEHELCCEAEDGLKTTAAVALPQQLLSKFLRTNSLNDQYLGVANQRKNSQPDSIKPHSSLPTDLQQQAGNASELAFQLVELKNRLIKSENDRQKLQQQLNHTIDRNAELGQELQALRDQLSQFNSLNHTDYNEGYGLGSMKSNQEQALDQSSASFMALQEKARNLLSSPSKQETRDQGNATVILLQMIEDFCREGDKVVECGKKERDDLQSQYAQLESQLREVNRQLSESNSKRDKFEVELKASIDKIFVLREIISELETQVQTKALNEQVLDEKAKQLEDYVSHQMRANDALQQEVHSLKTDIGEGYQTRIRQLEDKLQQGRPSAEQSMILNQVAEQLRDIETTLEQKTKALESLHNSNTASNSCSLSATEDVSVHGSKQPPTGEGSSPSHPSLSVEGVQRVAEKLDRHTRVEEAAIKRIRDLEMQVQQTRAVRVELEHERDSLQGRMDEQTHRISTLQTRLEEQRQRAEQLHRAGTSDLHARVHELQGEVQNLSEKLSARDKQMTTLRVQLKRSKDEITNLESELKVRHKPDRCVIERLEGELQQKGSEIHKLKEKIRTEMINRLALPDLMETMLADKNDEIDHLRDQLEAKEKELQAAQDLSQASSPAAAGGAEKHQQDASTKLSARTLSDIGSITEFPEPDVERRAAMRSLNAAPFQLSDAAGSGGNHFLQQTMEISKEAVANLTLRRTDDLSGFTVPHQVNTFENPHYFQGIAAQSSSNMMTPELVPRQINFSNLTEDSKLKTPSMMLILTPELPKPTTPPEVEELHEKLTIMEKEKQQDLDDMTKKLKQMEEQLDKEKNKLVMQERTLKDYRETEEKYRLRIDSLEEKLLETTSQEAAEKENLRKELNCVSAAHAQCEHVHRDLVLKRKQEVNSLNSEIKAKAEQLQAATERCRDLELHVQTLERDLERLKNSEHSSKQYSVDEIAQQVEKELNYSAQLDSNILKAIESEEENNLDKRQQQKEVQTEEEQQPGTGHGSEDENFTGERELLNQLEAVRAQLAVEREQCESLSKELMGEKQHSQEIQEQDVVIIEAMRKRLETALDAEDELHKQLDMERERCERLQTQLTSLQRAEGRRNSSLLLKSPGESPRKSPRADFEAELGERLRSEIKLLMAQNERERERSADAQRSSEREKQRYEKELQERIAYCERLKQEMEKLARDKDSAEQELEHFNERLTLQASEIESLESRLVTLQEAETRRANTRTRQHQELTKLHAEIHELKGKLLAAESSRDSLEQKITQLRFDVSRSAQREAKLAEALAQANDRLAHSTDDTVPAQFLQKMKEINTLLAENTQENRQMAETVQYLVGERIALQKRCEELGANGNVNELEERCRQLLGRYLRVESHRKALVYQKRYLKLTLESYQASEQMAMQAIAGGQAATVQKRPKKKLFKTVALAIIAIQRIKYIGRIWHTGKRIVSKSVFTITQQKNVPAFNVNAPPSPLPVANPKVPTNSSSSSNTNNIAGRLSYAPVSPPLVTFSTLQPIVLPQDYALQVPSSSLSHNNNNSNSSNNNNNNNNNNNYNESNLPSLAKLDWATTTTPQKQPKRAQPRLH
ncbi:golgin subfamily A member 4 isoform X6 [Drosophila tropicalis]|uniref:golgin subfamily A member 4 isoform X6 n=1 Tax=Drosophila tropicalis TaxID=46794 RepID=UPI0035AC0204